MVTKKRSAKRRAAKRQAALRGGREHPDGLREVASNLGAGAPTSKMPSIDEVRTSFPDYHKTRAYRGMSSSTRRVLASYMREYGMSDEAVFYQLYLHDLARLDTSEKKRANQVGEFMLVGVAIFTVVMVSTRQPVPIFLATGMLGIMTLLFVAGVFNPLKTEQRRAKRWLKRNAAEPLFDDWDA